MTQEYIGKTQYAGFWVFVREVWNNTSIMQNQAIFWWKVFEILWHGDTIDELKEMRGDAFWTLLWDKHQIYYFDMLELTYKNKKIIKYKILKIINS